MTQVAFTLRGRNPDVLTCIANLSSDEMPDLEARVVFYNYILKCYLLLDLKMRKPTANEPSGLRLSPL